ncbi:MAG: MFS transporter, partial [Thermoplasmata archaeon]|nr:MFS transporter [Thermoplasmata archaeon]
MSSTPVPSARPLGLLGNVAFQRLFFAGIASSAGFAIAEVCLVWMIFANTGSSLDVAFYGISGIVAGIAFSLVSGTLVDRYDLRRLMVASDAGRAAMMLALVLSNFALGFQLGAVLLTVFGVAALSTVFNPAENIAVSVVVGEAQVADANGLTRSSRSLSLVVASSLGGVLVVTVGPVPGLALNALTFLVSAALIYSLTLPEGRWRHAPSRPQGAVRRFLHETADGVRWLRGHQGLLELTASATFFNFFSTIFLTFLVFFAVVALHGSALTFAVLIALYVGGGGVGSLLVGRLHSVRYAGLAWLVPYGAASGVLLLLIAQFNEVLVAATGVLLIGVLSGFAGTSWLSAAQL